MTARALAFGFQMTSTIVLARLLSPEDFGLQGMVLAVTGFLGLFREAGLSVPSIQSDTLTREQASTLFWVNVAVGVALTGMTSAIAPMLVGVFREPRVLPIALVSSVAFLFHGLGVQHRALLRRSMRFGTMARIDILALAGSASLGIVMGIFGWGYWALVAMAVGNPLASCVGAWIAMRWLPGKPRIGPGVVSMLHMGGTLTLNSIVVYLAYNAEKFLLGRVWGAEALGLYGRAYQLANVPVQELTFSLGAVAFPVLARIQSETERLSRGFVTGYSVVISLTIPVTMICAVFAEEIVSVLLGPRWTATADLLRLLVPAALAVALINPFGWLLQATGRVGRSLGMALLIAPVVILGVALGLWYGPAGVAVGYSVAMSILVVPLIGWAKHNTGVRTADYWRAVKPPFTAALIAGGVGTLFKVTFGGSLPSDRDARPRAGSLAGSVWVGASDSVWPARVVRGYVDHSMAHESRHGEAEGMMSHARTTVRRMELKSGDWVEICSREEILKTLDTKGCLEGMPFMPEMFAFCGKRFKVFKRAHKTCDTVFPTRSRRVERAVHLETRCDGSGHGGCQAGCLIFWKEAWLKQVSGPVIEQTCAGPENEGNEVSAASMVQCTEVDVWASSEASDGSQEGKRYVCQATQLPYATSNLAWWDVRQYIEDYQSRNV